MRPSSVGTLSPRQAWCAAQDSREQARSEEQLQAIAVWEQELCWREFYQQALFHFPELADGPYREQWRRFPWENNADWFDFWKEGQTGMPIIDAAMRQLNQTGWMHNRCRMIVASLSGQGSDLRLALGRARLHGAGGGWRPGCQQRRLAMECQQRHGSQAPAHLQPRHPGQQVRFSR